MFLCGLHDHIREQIQMKYKRHEYACSGRMTHILYFDMFAIIGIRLHLIRVTVRNVKSMIPVF